MPLPDGVVFTRYDGDRTIFFTDRNGMLFRFDTGQRRAFPIFDLREELGRRGALSSVISDKDDYVLAFGMSGVLRLRSTDPIEGRYELQEIDVNCGVFALLSSSGKAGVENRTLDFTFPVKLSKTAADLCASRPPEGAKKAAPPSVKQPFALSFLRIFLLRRPGGRAGRISATCPRP